MSFLLNPLRLPPDPVVLQQGWAAVVQAKRLGGPTRREQEYIDAVEAFFKCPDCLEHPERELAYEQAMALLFHHYPEDREGGIFYALALLMNSPLSDTSDANRLKAAAILEQASSAQPDHPGVRLYQLQSYDTSRLAQRGLLLAWQVAKLTAVGPYALHLPAHIFMRLGRWEEAIQASLAAIASATKFTDGPSADMARSQRLHAMDALIYAYLQRGEMRAAQLVLDELQAKPPTTVEELVGAYALAAMPTRYALDRSRWAEAVVIFAQALGAARSGDPGRARQALERLEGLHHVLILTQQKRWAVQVEIQQRIAAAWIARVEHQYAEALRLMQAAVVLGTAYDQPLAMPGALLPTRELLAELLLECGHPQQAQQAFEAQLRVQPNRLNALYGAAHSAELSGNLAKAASFYEDVLTLRSEDASDHIYFAEAEAFLANIQLER